MIDPETNEEKTAEQIAIDEGEAAYAYLTSDGGSKLVHRRNEALFKKWMLSTSPAEREQIFAEFKSFNDFVAEVEATAARGKNAKQLRTRREEVAQRSERVYGPKK